MNDLEDDIPYFGLHVDFHCPDCRFWFYDSEDGSGRVFGVNWMNKGPVICLGRRDIGVMQPDREFGAGSIDRREGRALCGVWFGGVWRSA